MSDLTETQLPALSSVAERYLNLELISERQITCAFKAWDREGGRPVFIKMLRESKLGDASAERLFANEAGLLQFIARHFSRVPIAPVIDAGVFEDRPFFVQPLLEGFTLRAALRQHRLLAGGPAVTLMEDCLEFLESLNAAGVVHGDVSPDNIFIETAEPLQASRLPDQFQIRLLDYNSARRIDGPENQSERLVFLKLPYAAPELAKGYPLSPQSDLYSLGVVFYEAITGERPYDVRTLSEVAALRDDCLPPIPVAFDVPAAIEKFVRALAAVNQSVRPRSTSEALFTLRELKHLHRWLSQVDPLPIPAFYLRDERRSADRASAPYVALPGAPDASALDQPITIAADVDDSPPRSVAAPPESGYVLREETPGWEVPTVTEAVEPVPSVPPSSSRAEQSLAYWVPVPTPEQQISRVDFSVFAPASISPGTSFVLEVWAYLREQRDQLLELASRHERLIERGSRGPILAETGTELTLALRLDGFKVADPHESFYWLGEITNVPFLVEAPMTLRPGIHPGQINILHGGMLLTRLVFDLEVGEGAAQTARLGVRSQAIKSAFASYASADREEVLRRVQGIMAAGVDVFLDVLSLRAGDTWEEQLLNSIRETDIFYLFWSVAASKSKWVDREWRFALSEKGINYIQPVPLTDPREAPPPQELAGRHFNDLILAYLKSSSPGAP